MRSPAPSSTLSALATLACLVPVIGGAEPLPVATLTRTEPVDFGREVFPFLKQNCLACHNTTKAKAGLNLETPDLMKKGGDTGPAIEPGKGDASLLFTTAAHIEDPAMPPEKNTSKARNLTPEELALLKLWIDQGAKGGAVSAPAPEKWEPIRGPQPIYTAAVTTDGRFAAAGRGNQITIYDIALGREAGNLVDPALDDKALYPNGAAQRDHVQALSFSPQGDLASGGYRIAKIWRRAAAAAEAPVALPAEAVSLAQAADGTLAFGAADGTIVLLGPAADAKPVTAKDHGGAVTGLAFSADGKTLYSASADKTARRRTVAEPAKSQKLDLPAPANDVVLLKGDKLAFAGADHVVRLCATAAFDAPPPAPAPPAPVAPPAPAAPAAAPTPETSAAPPAPPADQTNPSDPKPAAPPPPAPPSPFEELKAHGKPVLRLLAGDAEGKLLLSGGEDGQVIVWDLAGKKPARQMAHGAPVQLLSVNPGFTTVASAAKAAPSLVKLWNLADGKALGEVKGDPVTAARVAELTRKSAVAKRLQDLHAKAAPEAEKKWKEESEKALKAAEEVAKTRRDLVAKRAAAEALRRQTPAAKPEDITKAQDEADKTDVALASAQRNADLGVRLAGDGLKEQLAAQTAAKDAEVSQQVIATEVEVLNKASAESDKAAPAGIAFAPDGSLAVVAQNGDARLWTGAGLFLEALPKGADTLLAAYASGGKLITVGKDKNLVRWTPPGAWSLVQTLGDGKDAEIFPDRVTSLAYSPSGNLLATGSGVPSRSGQVLLWNTATWTTTAEIREAHVDTVTALAFAPDGDRVVSGSTDKFVKTFRTDTGEAIQAFEGHTSHILTVDWSPDGLIIASAGADQQVKLWDIAAGQQKQKIEGYQKEITAITYLADTDDLLIASGDKSIKIGTTALPDNDAFLHAAAASADGKVIIAGGQDGALRLWKDRKFAQKFEQAAVK